MLRYHSIAAVLFTFTISVALMNSRVSAISVALIQRDAQASSTVSVEACSRFLDHLRANARQEENFFLEMDISNV